MATTKRSASKSAKTADDEVAKTDLGTVFYVEPGQDPVEVTVVDGDPTGEGVLVVKLPEYTEGEGDAEVTRGGGYPAVMFEAKANIGAAYWTREDPSKD